MMMTITEKIANLKGYLEGVKLDESKQETKIIEKIVDLRTLVLAGNHNKVFRLILYVLVHLVNADTTNKNCYYKHCENDRRQNTKLHGMCFIQFWFLFL